MATEYETVLMMGGPCDGQKARIALGMRQISMAPPRSSSSWLISLATIAPASRTEVAIGYRRARMVDDEGRLYEHLFWPAEWSVEQINAHWRKVLDGEFGLGLTPGTIPLVQDGRTIGSLPRDFDPRAPVSNSFMYVPRRGDFRFSDGVIIADGRLGPGDISCVEGFRAVGNEGSE